MACETIVNENFLVIFEEITSKVDIMEDGTLKVIARINDDVEETNVIKAFA